MALPFRATYRNLLFSLTKPVSSCCVKNNFRPKVIHNASFVQSSYSAALFKPQLEPKLLNRKLSNELKNSNNEIPPEEKKLGLVQRFKQMYRDYWYVLVPVHLATSAVWISGFYYVVQSGVDIISFMESMGISETLINQLRDSKAGYFALTFAMYKVAAPLRYAVTLGGTTYAIRRLTALGWIKPVPSRERIKEMIQERKDNLQDRYNESLQHYQSQIKKKQSKVVEEMRKYKMDMKNVKCKTKSVKDSVKDNDSVQDKHRSR